MPSYSITRPSRQEDYARFSPDTPIVIDNGGSSFRIGWAGESDPRVTFRNVVQRPRHKATGETVTIVGDHDPSLMKYFDCTRTSFRSPFDNNVVYHTVPSTEQYAQCIPTRYIIYIKKTKTALPRLAGERCRERTRRRLVLPRFSHWRQGGASSPHGERRRCLVPCRLNPRGEGGGASSHTRRRGVDSSLRGETSVLMVSLSSGQSTYRYPVELFEAPVVAALVRIFLRHRCFRVQLTSSSRDRTVASFATDGTSEASSALDAVVRSFLRCRYCCLMVPPSPRLLSSEGSFIAVPLSFPTFHHR
ncbi:hypothetical protein B296_00045990 [Ensete ventricosum]|uniref:Actin-related protein 5 n=1 Tax=Ensete ventricosum TaxID=4639 RepID=A0A426Z5M5_ENSVE|nr:hypothetical protein B296_00045990 [Ensete ventricosum]